jgi:DNA segregation ATPase FtsK/SpoIIIE, S-DNA-T family
MEFTHEPRLPAPSIPHGEIAVEAPPELPKAAPANPLARLLPVAMVVATIGMMALYFTSGGAAMRNPMFMFFPAMMLTSVVGTLAYGARGTNRTAEINENRRDYLRYIDTLDSALAQTVEDQHRSLQWTHPEPESLWTLVGGARMWERTSEDPDFCHVRVGVGDQPLCTTLVAPELGPADESDPVTSTALRRFIHQRSVIKDLPAVVALRAFSVITVDGDAAAPRALLRAMVCQLAVLHSPAHLNIAAVVGPEAEIEWEWLKWLPHHQHPRAVDAVGSARMTYRSFGDAAADCTPDSDTPPHLAVIVDGGVATGADPAGRLGGVTILEVGSCRADGAAARRLRLHIAGDTLTIHRDGGDDAIARPDKLTPTQALVCARRLAPYRPAAASTKGSATSAGWAELMGLDDPTHVDPAVLWASRRGEASLRVPIGISEHRDPVELDIKEAARNGMGPHGLCVGATGSGKSEFLRTLTLGMITAHPPEVLNLVLVDFKGGATFLGLERARHVSAIITNLSDEAYLVTRMRDALAGEMNRRQELLRAAGNFANVGDYQDARSQRAELPPLPVLFIVVDEFSELLSQHPDFAELFVAIGRVGRSLGMHLLLASQRLDEGRLRGLETHLSYRICLKTFSASESRAVLGVPDAYHLPSTPGAAYLKTASGELVRFQTAFVSGPHRERRGDASGAPARSETPMLFTAAPVGQVTERTSRTDERTSTSTRTLFHSVVDRLADLGTPAHRVWLPPLMGSPTLDMLIPRDDPNASLAVPIGLVDSPYEQRRDLLVAELAAAAGNVAVVGAPRSGKSTALRTLVMAMATTHNPADVQFYCLDFGGGSLSSLRPLPHVGSVAGRLDVDLCRRIVAVLESLVRTREARFRRLGIDSVVDYRRRRAADDPRVADDPFGDVFLVVDGWAALRQEFDSLEGPITALAAQGLSFGVHVVVAASRWAEMRPALKDQIGTRIELRLGDPADSEMDRKRARQLAGSRPGRGITRDGREMVIALPRLDGTPTTDDLAEAVAASAQRLSHRWDGRPAPPIELLPTHVHHHAVVAKAVGQRPTTEIVIGLGERELQPVAVDFAQQPHLVVLGEAECGKTSALRLLCREIVRTNDADSVQLEIVDFRRTLLGVVESAHLAGYTMSAAGLASRLPALLDRLQARMPGEHVTQQQLRARSWWTGPEIYLVIDDYDLVGAASGGPLARLADFLPHAKDLGLHVVVARRSGGAARAMFEPVLAGLRDVGCMGLMMSASPDEGILLGSVRPSSLPPGRGTLITRSSPDQLVQVGWTDPP